ncbi:MAG: histidinol-phosphatase [Acidobacteria bacterium]|nr:histidinol-phosphatase [Acidobacteriota bacterium]
MSNLGKTFAADLALAHKLADAADAITLNRFNALDLVITTKPDNTPVTDADKATEEKIRTLIAASHPNDHIIGEEFGGDDEKPNRYWVIDPIDGTKNFMRGIPAWATLIGLVEDGEVVVGVVSSPALFRRWHGSKGGGAFLSVNKGEPTRLKVSGVSQLDDASISFSDLTGWGDRLEKFLTLLQKVWRVRAYGDFWSHMLVAEGAVDIAAEPKLALWDMAALDVIIREAGGKFTDLDGTPGIFGKSSLSSNGLLHQNFLAGIK